MWIRPVWATIIVTTLVLTMASAPAHAEKRVALVIGNTAYQHTRILPNPRNDAAAIGKVLEDIGFKVTVKTDQGYGDMRRVIRDFGQSANGADIAVIHFAGHGLELAGENYLLPVDAKVIRDGDLEYETVTLTSVLSSVRGATKLRLVILDACRNNPLGDRMALSAGATRAVTRGLARIEPSGDVLVAYSAKHGTLAQDGTGPLSPYAEALVKHLATPGVDIRIVLGRVRDAVLAATERRQEPYIYGTLGGAMAMLVPGPSVDGVPRPPRRSSANRRPSLQRTSDRQQFQVHSRTSPCRQIFLWHPMCCA